MSFIKFSIDILLSLLGIIIAIPLLFVIAVLIKIDSKGSVLFKQKRIGRNKKPFYILKFRSMRHRVAEEIDQLKEGVLAKDSDNRITKIGRILRMTSLDELPQLFNILKGDMSLIGPRPIIPEQLQVIPAKYESRFEVKPGITGLSQVKGRRSLTWEQQLIYDCEYVRERSLFLDIKILFLTTWVVLARKGIYADESKNWRAYLNKENWD